MKMNERLRPSIALLQDERVLVQAWKKTVAHIRAHNWFADTLEIDHAALNLPRFLDEVRRRIERPVPYVTTPLRMVPAPKSSPWGITPSGKESLWAPIPPIDGQDDEIDDRTPRWRPLGHAVLRDQVVATAIMMCLADRVETIQGDPRAKFADVDGTDRVVSYGNRLLCDATSGERLEHRWGASAVYRAYFDDYQTFLDRPRAMAELENDSGRRGQILIVHSDLKSFYDCVRPDELAQKVRGLRRRGDDPKFFELASHALRWRWDRRDRALSEVYQQREKVKGFGSIALPQGLVSAGFFANVALLDFDDRLRAAIGTRIARGVFLVDVCRYVDDLRLVLRVSDSVVPRTTDVVVAWLQSLLTDFPELSPSRRKTVSAPYTEGGAPLARQSQRMNRIQHAVSGGFDASRGQAILESVNGLLRLQRRQARQGSELTRWPLSPVADVPDGTVARFTAGRFRTVYRSLRPLLPEDRIDDVDPLLTVALDEDQAGEQIGLGLTRTELAHDAQLFATVLVESWIEDPSNVRLLRIGLDIWPSRTLLEQILPLFTPYISKVMPDSYAQRMAWYCLAEIFNAGSTETGLGAHGSGDPQELTEYRDALREYAELVVMSSGELNLPWYLIQHAMLFLAASSARVVPPSGGAETEPYRQLLRFLSDPAEVSEDSEFATLSVLSQQVLGRVSFIESRVAPLVNAARLNAIAHIDPTTALTILRRRVGLGRSLSGYVSRDLSLSRASVDPGSLAALVLRGRSEELLRDELVLLRIAAALLRKFEEGTYGTITPSDVIIAPEDGGKLDSESLRAGRFKLEIQDRPRRVSSVYEPPRWCGTDERWRLQVGYLLRFILTAREDFTGIVRRGASGSDSYRPAPVHWRMRRYSFFNAHGAFGDQWLPITPWFEQLLLNLLAWPGTRVSGRRLVNRGRSAVAAAVERRIRDVRAIQGPPGGELLLRLDVRRPDPSVELRSLHACIVQTALPDPSWFRGDVEIHDVDHRRQLRNQLVTALEAVRTTRRLRALHKGRTSLDWLILPELAVHADDVWLLRQFARANRTIILAGLTYHETRPGGPLHNSAVWVIPEWSGERNENGGFSVRVVEQGKANLAQTEARLPRVEGFRRSQWLIGFPWSAGERLWLTASICYDATDLRLAADLTRWSDIYAIPALNKDVRTFDQMAAALHYHMFQMVIVANNGMYGGSSAYAPYREESERQVFHVHGQPQATVTYIDIDNIARFKDRVAIGRNSAPRRRAPQLEFKYPPAGI